MKGAERLSSWFIAQSRFGRGGVVIALGLACIALWAARADMREQTGQAAPRLEPRRFVHPGLLHSEADLLFMAGKVGAGEQPWTLAWEKMRGESVSALKFMPRPVTDVFRGASGSPDVGASAMMLDASAAYSQALQWRISADPRCAAKAIVILNAWSSTLRSISGHDAKLLAGLTAYKFCNAAEILRAPASGWPPQEITRFKAMLLEVFYPVIKDFFPKANGNWDAAMINSMLCIGVFCDDRPIYDRAVAYYLHGEGNGAIVNYVFESGQCQESTRDQAHTQLGLGMLAAACEVAWNQGDDLYGAAGDRLALGFEYTAQYNLGFEVPAAGKISPKLRGRFRPIYEKIYHHYVFRKNRPMPFTRQVLLKIRPVGWSPDHESWETLTCVRNPEL